MQPPGFQGRVWPDGVVLRLACISLAGGRGWVWGGCSDNVEFGERISKLFVDALETGHDTRALINLHNNEVGRLVSQIYNNNNNVYIENKIRESGRLFASLSPALCDNLGPVVFAWGKKIQPESGPKPEPKELQ